MIVREEIDGNKAIITMKHTDKNNFVANYEYRLIKKSDRWFLKALDYVDSDGKCPEL